MISIIATLKKIWSMLLGADIHVFTDHKHLTFNTLKTQCVLRLRTKFEEFSPMLHYIEGPCNILADNLSRLNSFSLQRILLRKKTKHISWIKNTLVYMMRMSGNVLSAISTYLTLHIRMRIHWLCTHSWIAATGQTTACSTSEISRQLRQLTTGWRGCWWHHLL